MFSSIAKFVGVSRPGYDPRTAKHIAAAPAGNCRLTR